MKRCYWLVFALLAGCGGGGGGSPVLAVDEYANRRGVWSGTWTNTDFKGDYSESGPVTLTLTTPVPYSGKYDGSITDTATGKSWTVLIGGIGLRITAPSGRFITEKSFILLFKPGAGNTEHLVITTNWMPELSDIGMTRGSMKLDLTKVP